MSCEWHIRAVIKPWVPLFLSSGDLGVVGSGCVTAFVGNHHAPDVVRKSQLEAPRAALRVFPSAIFLSKYARPMLLRIRTWVTAIRWPAEFSRRSPLRESRCRVCSPLAISIGATPAYVANACSDLNRDAMPVRPMSRTAVTAPIPSISRSRVPCSSRATVTRISMSAKPASAARSSRARSWASSHPRPVTR